MSKEGKRSRYLEIDEFEFFEEFFPPEREYPPEHALIVRCIIDAFRLAFVFHDDSELFWIICGDDRPHSFVWMMRLLELDPQAFIEGCRERGWCVDRESLRSNGYRILPLE